MTSRGWEHHLVQSEREWSRRDWAGGWEADHGTAPTAVFSVPRPHFRCATPLRPGERRQEVYHVSIMRIARMLGMATDTEAMDDVIGDTGELVEAAFANLDD